MPGAILSALSSTAPSPGGQYYPLAQVALDSPTSVLSSESEVSSDVELDEKLAPPSPTVSPWRATRPRLRSLGRFWRVLLAVVSFWVLHTLLPSDGRVNVHDQLASLSNSLPALPALPHEHGSFLQRLGIVAADDPLVRLVESRLKSVAPLPPYRFLVGTVQRSEGPALVEWVLHHLALGADHLVVFDASASSDDAASETRDRILPLVELGWVTLLHVDGAPETAHVGGAIKFRREWATPHARWSAFLDVNEFVVQREGQYDGAVSLLDTLEHDFRLADGVKLARVWVSAAPDAPSSLRAGVLETHTEVVSLREQDPFLAPRVIAKARADPSDEREPVILDLTGHRVDAGHGTIPPGHVTERYPLHVRRFVRRHKECRQLGKRQTVSDPALEALDRQACATRGVQNVEEDLSLVSRGASLRALVSRLEERWPVFDEADYRLSMLASPESTKREPLPLELEPGSTLVLDSDRSDIGHVLVTFSTSESRRSLPVTYRSDGGASFAVPPDTSREVVAASRSNATLTITRQYVSAPAPELDPATPCSIMGHLKNQPSRPQLLALANGTCKEVDFAQVGTLASTAWPHAKYRGEVVLSRSLRLVAPPADAPSSRPSLDIEPSSVTKGHWARHSLQSLVAASQAETDPQTRLYTSEACPRAFAASYWDESCGTHASRLEKEGVLRWVPDGARSYKGAALHASELRACLHANSDDYGVQAEKKRRILVVGDSVSSHSFLALQCLVGTHLGLRDSGAHVRFHRLQYEALDLAGATGEGATMGREEWDRFLAWEWDDAPGTARSYPHVVVVNVGLWPASWATAEGYASGLRTALSHLAALTFPANPSGPRLVWRETTAVFPTKVADPLYQVNPRILLFNDIAAREIAAARAQGQAIDVVKAFDMVAAREDDARDSAHLCPVVQGDLVETLMHRICRGGLLERKGVLF